MGIARSVTSAQTSTLVSPPTFSAMPRNYPSPTGHSIPFCAIPLITGTSNGTTMCSPNCHKLAKKRIIFQQWFLPADPHGRLKKWHKLHLAEVYVWQPKTYFGRVQVITVFDASHEGAAADHEVASARTPIFRSPERGCVRGWLSYCRGDDVRELLLRMAELNR